MATHRSAEKRNRQNEKRRINNRNAKAAIRTAMKRAQAAAKEENFDVAKEFAHKATRLLDKASIHGVMHKNTVARTKSRMFAQIKRAEQGTN